MIKYPILKSTFSVLFQVYFFLFIFFWFLLSEIWEDLNNYYCQSKYTLHNLTQYPNLKSKYKI